jgi:hypothetical protein
MRALSAAAARSATCASSAARSRRGHAAPQEPKLRASSPRAPQQRASPPRRLPLGNLSVLRCAPVRSEICLRCGRCGVPAALLRVPPLRVFRRPAPHARP